jgi:hypothetical protein
MAGLAAQGTLYIDLVDFWGWLKVTPGDKANFSIEDDAWVIDSLDGFHRYVDAADFWAWVIEKNLPEGLRACETLFGVPRIVSPDLVVTFAVSTEGSPHSWEPPPACLAEWKARK